MEDSRYAATGIMLNDELQITKNESQQYPTQPPLIRSATSCRIQKGRSSKEKATVEGIRWLRPSRRSRSCLHRTGLLRTRR